MRRIFNLSNEKYSRLEFVILTFAIGGVFVSCKARNFTGAKSAASISDGLNAINETEHLKPELCARADGTRLLKDGMIARPADLARDTYCMARIMKNCAPNGVVTFYGSARTNPTKIVRPPEDLNQPSEKELFEFTQGLSKLWSQSLDDKYESNGETQHTMNAKFPVSTGGGPGMMKAANSGVFQSYDSKGADYLLPEPIETTLFSLERRKVEEKRKKYGPSIGLTTFFPTGQENVEAETISQGCAFRASSFSQRQADLADRAAGFVVSRGGAGTAWEIFEAMTKIEAGLIPDAPIAFVSPYPLEWDKLIDRIREIASRYNSGHPSNSAKWFDQILPKTPMQGGAYSKLFSFQKNSKLLFTTNQTDAFNFLKANVQTRSFETKGNLTGTRFSPTGADALAEGKLTFAASDCDIRFESNAKRDRVASPASPKDVARDAFCTELLLQKNAVEQDSTGRSFLVVIGSRHTLEKGNDDPIAQKIRKVTQAWATKYGDKKPILTIGGGGYLNAAHLGAADAKVKSAVFYLDYGPQLPINRGKDVMSYTFTSLSQRESELIDRAQAILIAPTDIISEWELFHVLTKLQTQKLKSVPVALVSSSSGWVGNEWTSLSNRLDSMMHPAVGTIQPSDKNYLVPISETEQLIKHLIKGKR